MGKTERIGIALLAAGLGKRMGKKTAKPLVPLMGRRLIDFPLKAAKGFVDGNQLEASFGVVLGHQRQEVQDYLSQKWNLDFSFPFQKEQLGTADALKSYFEKEWTRKTEYTVILCADTPLLTQTELSSLWEVLGEKKWDAIAATFHVSNPFGYGRIVRGKSEDKGFSIVEEKDATEAQREIREVNSGLYICRTQYVYEKLCKIENNNSAGEFYLTDIFEEGANVGAHCFGESQAFLGVNNPLQLEQALAQLKLRINRSHQERGVHILDGLQTYIEEDVEIGRGTTIYPGCFLFGKTKIGEECLLEPGVIVRESLVEDEVTLRAYCFFEKAKISSDCVVGPYARLRPGTEVGEGCKIGNFVEIKKTKLHKKTSISHLSYVGDAEVGENVNIGCGFITCNYDGESKHRTVIGKNSFIGSDTQIIAPVKIGESSFVASGSTINRDIPDQGFAISRGRQVTKEKMAKKFLKGKWAIEDL